MVASCGMGWGALLVALSTGRGSQRRWLWEQDTMESQRRGTTFSSVGVAGVLSYDPQVTIKWTSADNEHTSACAGHAVGLATQTYRSRNANLRKLASSSGFSSNLFHSRGEKRRTARPLTLGANPRHRFRDPLRSPETPKNY